MGTWGGQAAGASGGEKPSRTRAGGRGERRGSPALPRRERKNEILDECENPTSLNHRETKFYQEEHI